MARNSKRNWDELKNRSYMETTQGRDVYGEQQLGRGKLQEKQSMTSRMVGAVALGLAACLVVYMLIGAVASIMAGFSDLSSDITRFDNQRASMVEGECIYEERLMPLDTGEARDLDGNIYVRGANGWYAKSDETMTSRYGEEALQPVESEIGDGAGMDESAGPGFSTDTWIHDLNPTEGLEDSESDALPEPETPYWTNWSEHDAGEGFTASVTRGSLVLTPLQTEGLYRDDTGHVYEISGDHAVEIHSDLNQYFDANPDLVPAKKSAMAPQSVWQVVISLAVGLIVFAAMQQVLKKNLTAQNMLADTEDINQYTNDQHIALPQEVQRRYNWFPDVGAHSSVEVSSMISHMALINKGVKKIQVARRYKENVIGEGGVVVYYKGEIMRDENGNIIFDTMPMFDEKFAEALFEASGAPKEVRESYDPSVIPYNPGNKNREKLTGPYDGPPIKKRRRIRPGEAPVAPGRYEMVTDLINKDWTFPEYEPQRPAGAYIVDSAPVNTMV